MISGEIPLWLVDGDDRVAFVNDAAVRTLGFDSDDELVGRPSHDSIHFKHPDGSPYPVEDCPITHATERGEPIRIERDWWVRKDGSMVPISIHCVPLEIDGRHGDRDDVPRPDRERAGRGRSSPARGRAGASRRGRCVAGEDRRGSRRAAPPCGPGSPRRRSVESRARRYRTPARAPQREDVTGEARSQVAEALVHARSAIEELRELVHGIHPALLSHRGLSAAVGALADRASVPVRVEIADERYPSSVESAAYFMVAEALTNVTKYARASSVRVATTRMAEQSCLDDRRRWHRWRATLRRQRSRRTRRPSRRVRRHAHGDKPTRGGTHVRAKSRWRRGRSGLNAAVAVQIAMPSCTIERCRPILFAPNTMVQASLSRLLR